MFLCILFTSHSSFPSKYALIYLSGSLKEKDKKIIDIIDGSIKWKENFWRKICQN